MKERALDYLCERLGAKRVARWYVSLWNEHGLSVARGTLPERPVTGAAWREYLELVCLPLCCTA
jgi:hypothetical protein